MSSTEAINDEIATILPIDFESVERDEEKIKGIALDAATQTHFKGVNNALMEVVNADFQRMETTRPAAKNSMIATFKIMQIVMKTLRKSAESSKAMNKLLKQEWKTVSEQQSANNQAAKKNIDDSGKFQYLSIGVSQAHMLAKKLVVPLTIGILGGAGQYGMHQNVRSGALKALAYVHANQGALLKVVKGAQTQLASALGEVGKQVIAVQQYEL